MPTSDSGWAGQSLAPPHLQRRIWSMRWSRCLASQAASIGWLSTKTVRSPALSGLSFSCQVSTGVLRVITADIAISIYPRFLGVKDSLRLTTLYFSPHVARQTVWPAMECASFDHLPHSHFIQVSATCLSACIGVSFCSNPFILSLIPDERHVFKG